ncbi:MAG TPA: hypothetical protein VHY08_02125 [Bacillota bacterium]|nr:hypothetical protein [Bacillota bacterium]
MNVIIKREVFNSLADDQLIWACIEPAIQPIRGRNFQVKSQIYSELTPGQRALLMFQVLYGHTRNGVAEFFDHTSYFLAEPGVWSEFKTGMRYFGDHAMLQLLEEIERLQPFIKKHQQPDSNEDFNGMGREPGNSSTILTAINQLDAKLQEIIPETLHRIGEYIRNNPGEFVQFI